MHASVEIVFFSYGIQSDTQWFMKIIILERGSPSAWENGTTNTLCSKRFTVMLFIWFNRWQKQDSPIIRHVIQRRCVFTIKHHVKFGRSISLCCVRNIICVHNNRWQKGKYSSSIQATIGGGMLQMLKNFAFRWIKNYFYIILYGAFTWRR